MIHWAIVNMKGELEGEPSAINYSSSIKSFNDYQPPIGFVKVLLTVKEYEELLESHDRVDRFHVKKIDLITLRPVELTEEEVRTKKELQRRRINESSKTKDGE